MEGKNEKPPEQLLALTHSSEQSYRENNFLKN